MIAFQNFEQQADSTITALCSNCGWTGPSNKAQHLANDPVCPNCKQSTLDLLEEDDDPGVDL